VSGAGVMVKVVSGIPAGMRVGKGEWPETEGRVWSGGHRRGNAGLIGRNSRLPVTVGSVEWLKRLPCRIGVVEPFVSRTLHK
jgi:hypothetical protein